MRHCNVGEKDDLDESLAFLVPFLMHDKGLKVQVFVSGSKTRHNLVCKCHRDTLEHDTVAMAKPAQNGASDLHL